MVARRRKFGGGGAARGVGKVGETIPATYAEARMSRVAGRPVRQEYWRRVGATGEF
jgi:hypothetical protein